MNKEHQVFTFFGVALLTSVSLSYVAATLSQSWTLDVHWTEKIFIPAITSLLYLPFVLVGGAFVGVPLLLLLRKANVSSNFVILFMSGAFAGGVAAYLLLGALLGLVAVKNIVLLGAIGGASASIFWWYFIERHHAIA
ncbi:hypothetical protein [Altererythrobacter sp. ZODW24]|uniref:hypothetical protein n=1 Tax=Altererythrobacter sp. ZODW24 TaxID=2185142 RepID=UPI000DF7EE98|nr:hypothetical protein [Altererythrobacter sp. ZODW24]